MCVCKYVCACVWMWLYVLCVWVCGYVFVSICTRVGVYIRVCEFTWMCEFTCMCIRVCTCVHVDRVCLYVDVTFVCVYELRTEVQKPWVFIPLLGDLGAVSLPL